MIKLKKVLYFLGLFFCFLVTAYAADKTGISGLDTTIQSGQETLKVVAKWGGIAVLIICGLMFGMGKAKGEAVGLGFWLIVGLGLIIAAFGWWDTAFTSGFAL